MKWPAPGTVTTRAPGIASASSATMSWKLAGLFAPRPGLSVVAAGQTYTTLSGPELYHLLTVDLGWTPEQHQKWLTRLLDTELLGPA